MTKTMKVTETRRQFSQILSRVSRGETRVLVERGGVPVAAIVSTNDLERLNQYDARRAERFAALDTSWQAFEAVDAEQIDVEVAKAVASARRKLQKERAARQSA